jgi:serine-aspartate repeat-containing protein C/D/E
MRRRSTLWFLPVFAITALLGAGAGRAFGQFSGSILVTDGSGSPVADNIFATRDQVFFEAGPSDAGCLIGSLADGTYAFQVTDAAGTTLLSTDDVSNRMFLVSGGVIADNAPGGTHVGTTPATACGSRLVAASPFNLAPKQTGVYKLWVQPASFCGTSGCDFLPQNSDTVNFVVQEKARCLATHCISGLVFSDTNSSGTQDSGEPGLPGVLIVARDSHGVANTAVTGPDGTFTICGLTETSYTISEVVPAGYRQTAPADNHQISRYLKVENFVYLLTICNASTPGLVFGNFPLPSSISGKKFNDANGNGLLDPGEAGVGGITIQLFAGANANGSPLATTVTDGSGNFSFTSLTAGIYSVTEVLPSGYRQTSPSILGHGFYIVSIAPGQNVQNILFGNQLIPQFGAISGMKFNDINGNGALDPGEPGLAGVTMVLLGPAGTPVMTTTDAAGNFSFQNLTPSTYTLSEVVPAGYQQTLPPPPGTITVTVTGGNTVSNVVFGNHLVAQVGAISGMKFNDINGNGALDPGEPGLAGVTIILQSAGGTPVMTTTDAAGNFSFQNLAPGTYTLSEALPTGYQQTFPPPPGSTTVTVTAGQTVANVLFGNQLIPATAKGSISGLVFYDFNKNLIEDPKESGLPNVTVNLFDLSSHLIASTVTDANGLFTFQNVPAGDYTVSPVPPPKFFQTLPINNAPISVHVNPGQQVTGLVFGLTC